MTDELEEGSTIGNNVLTVDEEKKELDKEKHGEEINGGSCTNVENYRNHASALPYAIIVCYRHLVVLQSLIKREAKINRNNDWRTQIIEEVFEQYYIANPRRG